MLTVQKFGGSSVAGAEAAERVAVLIAKAHEVGDVVAVLSAAGNTSDILTKKAGSIAEKPCSRELDALLSTGELESVSLMAMRLHAMGTDCVSLSGRQAGILTDRVHGDARIIDINTARIRTELKRGRVVIVAGFQGIDDNDDITTLGRGGSDTTAAALAAALGADRCEIYTDVDGIYTADPRLVKNAKKLDAVDCDDMLLLARNGSQVLHPRSVETAMNAGTDIVLRSSIVPVPGTVVTHLADRPEFCGVTRDKNAGTVSLVGRGVSADTAGVLTEALRLHGIEAQPVQSSGGICTLKVSPDDGLDALRLIHLTFF